jgi:hypothetical protein
MGNHAVTLGARIRGIFGPRVPVDPQALKETLAGLPTDDLTTLKEVVEDLILEHLRSH